MIIISVDFHTFCIAFLMLTILHVYGSSQQGQQWGLHVISSMFQVHFKQSICSFTLCLRVQPRVNASAVPPPQCLKVAFDVFNDKFVR